MNKRAFLLGTGVCLAVAAARLPAVAEELYGVGPAMTVLPAMRTYNDLLEGYAKRIHDTIVYGNPEYSPEQFAGFWPSYETSPEARD